MKENFIPYELSVKLKEKGFDAEFKYSLGYYDTLGNFMSAADHWFLDSWIIAPTISQVLKWMREEKKIYIMIDRSFSVKNSWHYIICNNDDFEHLTQQESIPNRKWELAAIAGIKYCLDNLI